MRGLDEHITGNYGEDFFDNEVGVRTNCGHYTLVGGCPDGYGYTWCLRCGDRNTLAGLQYCTRVCGLYSSIGTIVSESGMHIGDVTDEALGMRKTPTGGQYYSHHITVKDGLKDALWYANVRRDSDALILRRA